MAVEIRFSRHGRKNVPFYRLVATDKENPRDGRYIELLGTMNPATDPPTIRLKEDRIKYWLGVGAKPSHTVGTIINREFPGYWDNILTKQRAKITARRKKRKMKAKPKAKKKG